jgi:hypothetical protein
MMRFACGEGLCRATKVRRRSRQSDTLATYSNNAVLMFDLGNGIPLQLKSAQRRNLARQMHLCPGCLSECVRSRLPHTGANAARQRLLWLFGSRSQNLMVVTADLKKATNRTWTKTPKEQP